MPHLPSKGHYMMWVLVGENWFLKQQKLADIATEQENEAVRYDGETLTEDDWYRLTKEQSLFIARQTIIIDDLSKNSSLWEKLMSASSGNDNTIILIETKMDKRSKAWKSLQKEAKIVECVAVKAQEANRMKSWLTTYAKDYGVVLTSDVADEMIHRAVRQSDTDSYAIIDQQLLATVVQQLSTMGDISMDMVEVVLAPSNHDNIFELFATALAGKVTTVHQMITRLSQEQDGYQAMGLLSTQIQQLAGLLLGDERNIDKIAGDLAVHPYPLRQLSSFTKTVSRNELSKIIHLFAEADVKVKSGKAEPWIAIENALLTIASDIK